jgi:mono/diheme cytochrome c family protein
MPTRLLVFAVLVGGCSKPATMEPVAPSPIGDGAALYAAQCASCHGSAARGGIGHALVPLKQTAEALRLRIVTTMPPGNEGSCDESCARAIVTWLMSLPADQPPLVCDSFPPARRQLRLLTRREYANSIADLLGAPAGRACTSDAACTIATESCVSGACVPDGCGVRTFLWRANGRRPTSIHVAGSFNGWPATVAAGGWAMTLVAGSDSYVVKRPLANGAHQYKFVIDGQWVLDDTNPERASDGFGGNNSVLTVQCSGTSAPGPMPDLVAAFPPESRPKGFVFDNNAEAGLVTSGHVEASLGAAASIAGRVTSPCRPTGSDRRPCAEQFITSFGRKVFRRPLSAAEVTRYSNVVVAAPDFDAGVKQAAEWLFSSPHFLYRSELGVAQPDGTFRLTPWELATALSYSLWQTTPDDALLDAAAQGKLATSEDVSREARRMLTDPRARAALRTFATQWLGIERLTTVDKAPGVYPSFTPELRASMADETPAFFEHVVFDGTGRFEELFTAPYSFVDAPLARHYGLESPPATREKRDVPVVRAAGLLGHASVLSSYAHSDQSSPVKRGVFVREHLLCQDFPTPPANAGGVPKVDPNATTRERFRQHAADASCRACHQYIDEVGFGFEGFDAIGGARALENGKTIDTTGELRDVEAFGAGTSTSFTSLPQLATQLAQSQRAKSCFATMVFRQTRGRHEREAERCTVEALSSGFLKTGGDVRELFVQALADERFLTRSSEVAP